jgi:adenosylmethionine-8-amino-7-oxononanoate aminotransferase
MVCNDQIQKGEVRYMTHEDMRELAFEHMFVALRSTDWLKSKGNFKTFVKGDGIRVTDIEGNSFIDGAAGWQYGAAGHGRIEVGEAMLAQIRELAIVAPEYTNVPCIRLAAKLAELAPGDLSKVAFCNSGSEAVETALKLSKEYHVLSGEPRRYKVIGRKGSYHGWTYGAMSVGGNRGLPLQYFEPLAPIGRFAPQPYCYRCEFGMEYPSCEIRCAKEIENMIQFENPETVSAVLGEPVSHSAYVSVPPKEYWPMVRAICDKYGVLLINDEVITGFGRLGKWFGCMNWDSVPDILTFAKGVTSGYIPMGGAITSPKIGKVFEGGDERTFFQLSTWGGNPVSAAGAMANIGVLEREGLIENSANMGKRLLDGLNELRKYKMVGDVRGLGLCACVEFVGDAKTKAEFPAELKVIDRIFGSMEDEGLLAREFGANVLLTPPLCISSGDVDEVVRIMERVVARVTREIGY